MNVITLSPERLRVTIEEHFNSCGLNAKLYTTSIAQSGTKINSVRFEGVFNSVRILEIDIYFNGHYDPILTGFKGICPISELVKILTELNNVIDNL